MRLLIDPRFQLALHTVRVARSFMSFIVVRGGLGSLADDLGDERPVVLRVEGWSRSAKAMLAANG